MGPTSNDRNLDGEALEVADGVLPVGVARADSPQTLSAPPDPEVRIVVGYAGWGAGQLDVELAESAWLMAPVQRRPVLRYAARAMWETAIRRLGAEPSALQGSSGVH